MHKSQLVLMAIVCFSMINIPAALKAAAPEPKPGPANAEFKRVFEEWKTLVGQLGSFGRRIA